MDRTVRQFMDDPRWADFIPDDDAPAPRRPAIAHGDCSPIDVDSVAAMLLPGGAVGSGMAGYEERPGQLDMVRAVGRAFNAREHLMVEAGTGVGKSLAYVLPAMAWARLNGTPVVVSTATRNLQTQLAGHDIPLACAALAADDPSGEAPKAALLKGRANYLCLRNVDDLNHEGAYALSVDELCDFESLIAWLHRTDDGDLDTLETPFLRKKLSCPGDDCTGNRCPFRRKCFVYKARNRAQKADMIVANHALVLSEASCQGGILPPYAHIVFDEAHDLESVATDFFSFEFSLSSLDRLLGRISRKATGKRAARGVAGRLAYGCDSGLFSNGPLRETLKETALKLEIAKRDAATRGSALLEVAARLLSPQPTHERVRYRTVKSSEIDSPPHRQHALNGLFTDYTPAQWDEPALESARIKFEGALARLANLLRHAAETLARASDGDSPANFNDLAGTIADVGAEVAEYMHSATFVLSGDSPGHVFWVERMGRDGFPAVPAGRNDAVALTAAPLSVAGQMHKLFHDAKDSVIMASATLRVRGKFTYAAKRLGLTLVEGDRVRTCVAASPFDYFRQSLTLSLGFMPPPDTEPYAFAADAADFLAKLFTASGGRGLVLFTAYEMMRAVRDLSEAAFSALGLTLLVQGGNATRESMVERLRHPKDGERVVLFGTQSFWEGVDVPGDALSCVAIARIPFPQRNDPVCEARCEAIAESGGSAFSDYMLPEAEIKFRQGFGRLIRKKGDRGVVVILDSRLSSRNYGAILRKSLPGSVQTAVSTDDALGRVAGFLSGEF